LLRGYDERKFDRVGKTMVSPKATKKTTLLGLGLDNKDGHLRVTQGENFHLVGGSDETHSTMQEKAIKFNEKLRSRGRRLEEVSREEFRDIAREIGLTDKNLPESE
jgi:hypothetical protein